MSKKIVVVGSINADLTCLVERHPLPGETLLGSGGEVSPGGKGANQAVAAALLGAQVTFVGAVGKDPNAEKALRLAQSAGVDLSGVKAVDEPTGLALITVSRDGENTIIVVPGANSHVDAAFVDEYASTIRSADIMLLQGEIPPSGIEKAVLMATGRVVINLAPVIDVAPSALLKADPLVVNEHEAADLLERLSTAHDAKSSADSTERGQHDSSIPSDEEAIARELHTLGFASVVITLGKNGALVVDSTGIHPIPTPTISPVDTTGAGDAFTGALVARLAQGDCLIDAASFAARVGATAALKPGAQTSYPCPDEVV